MKGKCNDARVIDDGRRFAEHLRQGILVIRARDVASLVFNNLAGRWHMFRHEAGNFLRQDQTHPDIKVFRQFCIVHIIGVGRVCNDKINWALRQRGDVAGVLAIKLAVGAVDCLSAFFHDTSVTRVRSPVEWLKIELLTLDQTVTQVVPSASPCRQAEDVGFGWAAKRMKVMSGKHSTNNITVVVVPAKQTVSFEQHLEIGKKKVSLGSIFVFLDCGEERGYAK